MTSNAYGRLSGANALGGQGGSTAYGGGYGLHGNHASHVAHNTHGAHGGASHTNNDSSNVNNVAPEDYLDKQNVNNLLRDAVSLLLENRPANPILFMAEHFRNMQQSQPQYAAANTKTLANGQQVNVLNSNILKAYRLITLNKYDAKSFSDNVFNAYTMIEKDHSQNANNFGGNSGIKGNDLIKLTQMLCIDYPSEILNGILKLLDKKEEENVDFDEFLNAIKTIMLYDNYFEEMEVLFKYLDTKKAGKIKKNDLVDAVAKLRKSIDKNNQEDGKPKCDLRVPSEDDLEAVYTAMVVEEEGYLSYDEYLTTLFKVTQEITE